MTATYTRHSDYSEMSRFSAWFRSMEVRESIDSILIAILLALMFRFFEAEAFVIPTGSMAPDLQGEHLDLHCPECGYNFLAGASPLEDGSPARVVSAGCPMCRHVLELKPHESRNHRPFSGDRILVNKYAYDFAEPDRWDVIVFKYPLNGKQNFIKRLIGLPGESVLIESGDVYSWNTETGSFADKTIARKSHEKLNFMLMVVDDTDYFPEKLEEGGWPSLWAEWSRDPDNRQWSRDYDASTGHQTFRISSPDETRWLRYRHLKPRPVDWSDILRRDPPSRLANGIPAGELITDYYAYNETVNQVSRVNPQTGAVESGLAKAGNGLHWVGDLGIKATVESESDGGTLYLQAVEGGVAFTCAIDLSSGKATASATGDPDFALAESVVGQTSIKGKGKWEIQFVNADNALYLWVDGYPVELTNAEYIRPATLQPVYRSDGPSDAEPLGIGADGASLIVHRILVLRDLYYTSKNNSVEKAWATQPQLEYRGFTNQEQIESLMQTPGQWDSPRGVEIFQSRQRDASWAFQLAEDQFLPMGDNSPQSKDARIWEGDRYIDRSYLLGEALLIYWPHAKTSPLPFWPNFERMTLIH